MRILTRFAVVGAVALLAPGVSTNLAQSLPGQWASLSLEAPNAGAQALAGGPAGSAVCDAQHRAALTALGVKAADTPKVSGNCPSEIAIFRQGAAMTRLQFNLIGSAPATGPLPTTAPRRVDVKFFILTECRDEQGHPTADPMLCAKTQLQLARRVFSEQRTGITFPTAGTPGMFTDLIAAAGALKPSVDCEASTLSTLKGIGTPASSGITVYYTGAAGGRMGITCPSFGGALIVIGGTHLASTLAHELGHAFTLRHRRTDEAGNGTSDNTNLMIASQPRGEALTLGQSFRANLSRDSRLNDGAASSWPLRACADTTISEQCPAVLLDGKRPKR